MRSSSAPDAAAPRTLYLPQVDENGFAYVEISRPGEEPEYHRCRDKEEACFWARRWMWRDRIERWEGDLFDTDWIEKRTDH